jgi:hypothetical protein
VNPAICRYLEELRFHRHHFTIETLEGRNTTITVAFHLGTCNNSVVGSLKEGIDGGDLVEDVLVIIISRVSGGKRIPRVRPMMNTPARRRYPPLFMQGYTGGSAICLFGSNL